MQTEVSTSQLTNSYGSAQLSLGLTGNCKILVKLRNFLKNAKLSGKYETVKKCETFEQ